MAGLLDRVRGTRDLTAVVVVALLVGAGCTFTAEERPRASDAAATFAAAITSGDLTDVLFVEGADAAVVDGRIDEVAASLGDVSSAVEVARFESLDRDVATAVLDWRWTLADPPGAEWRYETTVDLELLEDGWAVRWEPSVLAPDLRDGEVLGVRSIPPTRGDVLDAGGVPLVFDRPVLRIGIDKTRVAAAEAPASAAALAALLGLEDVEGLRRRTTESGARAFVEALVVRHDGSFPVDRDALAAIPGAVALAETLPLAPTRDFARPILGTFGEATAELIEESGGRLRVGDRTGLSGLQRAYDEQLSGTPGMAIVARPADGGGERELLRVEPDDGEPLTTTFEPVLQQAAEDLLTGVGPASAIVAVRPSTGHVAVAASGPGADGFSTATLGRYPPGSTFKVVTALALLRAGLGPAAALRCAAEEVVDGRSFGNYDNYPVAHLGTITLEDAVAYSCNTAFAAEAERVSQADLAEAAASLGLGLEPVAGVPSFAGVVPVETTATGHAAAMFGQGEVLASPLAMATVAASIAAGRTVTPRLVIGETEPPVPEPDAPAVDLGADEAAQVAALMRASVERGSSSLLADVPGPEIAAKTGTAEFGTEEPPRTHGWMVAIQGDLAVAVFVEEGSGAATAGPILEAFLRAVRPGG